ncbi:MAG: cytochrome c, class [Ferruginibacter sp.]|nr:cytochrome c, class [Ferruginibacter sp.]
MKLRSMVIFVCFLIIISPIWSCNQRPESRVATDSSRHGTSLNRHEVYIDLKKVLTKDANRKTTDVNVRYDPFFKTSKKFRGYYINPLIDSVIKTVDFDTGRAIIIFECNDGYRPVMDLSKIYGNTKGYIAFKDLENGLPGNWPDSVDQKFAPYYLVWDDVKKQDKSFTWPYGLTGLKLMSGNLEYKRIYPYKDTTLTKGFNLFRENCFKCHSINKVGGTVGPEFNFPRNITEYWKEEDMLAFVKNPASYRYNSRMPPVTNVSDMDLNEIIKYIRSMKNNKLIN